jgi:hypothetical protein
MLNITKAQRDKLLLVSRQAPVKPQLISISEEAARMLTFRLDPIDSPDSAWEGSPFIEPVWIEATDETAARLGVTALARRRQLATMPDGGRGFLRQAASAMMVRAHSVQDEQ